MIKKSLMLLAVLFSTIGIIESFAQTTLKDRAYYATMDAVGAYGTVIKADASGVSGTVPAYAEVNLGSFAPTTEPVYFTIVAAFSTTTDGIDGYVVAGRVHSDALLVEDAEDDKNPTFASAEALNGQSVTLPKYIQTLSAYSGTTTQESEETDQLYSAYRGKTYLVVGADYSAFASSNVAQINFPSSVTYLGYSALRDAGSPTLGFHNGSETAPFIGTVASYGSDDWKTYNSIESLDAFSLGRTTYTNMDQVVVADKLISIDEYAFEQCSALTSVTLGTNVEKIGMYAFALCGNLVSFDCSASSRLTTIGSSAFEMCDKLNKLVLSHSVTTINDRAFAYCGFSGRFDIPTHLKHIGRFAFAYNAISYIPFVENRDDYNGLFIEHHAFLSPNDLTMDFTLNDAYKLPPLIKSSGRPFDVYGQAADGHSNRVRIVVPLGSGEAYCHGLSLDDDDILSKPIGSTSLFSIRYHHHEYRVKFNLTYTYTKPKYGQPTSGDATTGFVYDEAPWWVASSAWHNDRYIFRPTHGGTVDTYAKVLSTNQMGITADLWIPTWDYFVDPGSDLEDASDDVEMGEQHLFPRTAHQYFSNQNHDNIPKILTYEIPDGIVPADNGILLAYTQAAYYLVPLYADYSNEVTQILKVVPTIYGIRAEDTTKDKPTTPTRVRAGINILYDSPTDPDDVLTGDASTITDLIAEGDAYWVDLNDETAMWRDVVVWYEENNVLKWRVEVMDLLNGSVTANDVMTATFTRSNGEEHLRYDYWTRLTSLPDHPYRCATYYNRFKLSKYDASGNEIDWVEACERGREFVLSLLGEPTVDPNATSYSTYDPNHPTMVKITPNAQVGHIDNDYFKGLYLKYAECSYYNWVEANGEKCNYYGTKHNDFHCRQWINILDVGTQTETVGVGEVTDVFHHLHEYLADYGNVLVPCVAPRMIYPFWTVSDENDYDDRDVQYSLDAEAGKYYPNDTYTYYSGSMSYVADGYASFGLYNGTFVQPSTNNYTQPNRAYFRVPAANLHPDSQTQQAGTRMTAVIADGTFYDDFGNVVTSVNPIGVQPTMQAGWFTLDGRRLTNAPKRGGVYIHNGRKVVVK